MAPNIEERPPLHNALPEPSTSGAVEETPRIFFGVGCRVPRPLVVCAGWLRWALPKCARALH